MRSRFSERLERLLLEARALVVVPEEEEPWAEAERADPARLADRLGLPLTEEERERLRHPKAPDEPHASMLGVARCLWEVNYDPHVPRPPRSLTPAEGEWVHQTLEERLRRLAQSPGPPATPAEVLADWLFGHEVPAE